MKKYNKITPEGTKDLLFGECFARRNVERKLSKLFSSRGFHEVITPGLEFYDVFALEGSGISQEEMYKATDCSGRTVVFRPDLTMPIARLTATRLQNQPKPVRLYYTQPVYRNDHGRIGKSHEITQTGVELLGASGLRADLEVITAAVEAINLCAPDFRLEIGHAGFFRALAAHLPVSEEVREDVRAAIESKNYAALNTILDTLKDSEPVRAMRRLPRLFGGEEIFAEAEAYCIDEDSRNTLSYLRDVYQLLSDLGLGGKVIVDLSLVQRINYYTGIIFSAYVEEYGDAVLSGGRYDNLLSLFGAPMPAIGFAMNADALAGIAMMRGEVPEVAPPKVLVHGESGYEMKAIAHSARLTQNGVKSENSVFETREEAIAYARDRGIERIDFVGEKTEACMVVRDGGAK